MTDKIAKYIKLIEEKTGSNTFCVLPWIHMATRPNGDARLCCVANASGAGTGDHTVGLVKDFTGKPSNFGKNTIQQSWNNDYMKNVRKTMLAGKIPDSCKKCFEEEKNKVVSKRLWEIYDWHNEGLDFATLVSETKSDGTVPDKIRYFDLRLGHTCNIKCVMCSPHDSSRWTQDHEELLNLTNSDHVRVQMRWDKTQFDNRWHERPDFWDGIFEQIPNIKKLYFAGGEPLMIKEHRRFLEEIIHRGYANQISLRYNSNGLLLDDDMIEMWKNFKFVKFNVSVDSIAEKNFYIRYPSDWETINRVLKKLDNTPDNIVTSVEATVQALNIFDLPDLGRWMIEQDYKKINKHNLVEYQEGGGILSMHLLYIPTFLSARILPNHLKEQIKDKFFAYKEWLYENYTKSDMFWNTNPYAWQRWEAILRFVSAQDDSHLLPDFREYISNLDTIRKTDAKKIFPELRDIL